MTNSLSLEKQIKVQQEYMWTSLAWAAFILILGVGLTIFLYYKADNDTAAKIPELLKVGPLFISGAVTAFPGKIFMECRARVATYRNLEDSFKYLDQKAQKDLIYQVMTEAFKQTVIIK